MMNPFQTCLGSLPQRLPQLKTAGAKKGMLWVPSTPAPGINRGKVPVPDSSCS